MTDSETVAPTLAVDRVVVSQALRSVPCHEPDVNYSRWQLARLSRQSQPLCLSSSVCFCRCDVYQFFHAHFYTAALASENNGRRSRQLIITEYIIMDVAESLCNLMLNIRNMCEPALAGNV